MLPSILDGLADEAEGVRDAALAAGRTFVDLYAETALPLLLPAVEDGILNDNWRIRQSSVELLGQLLFKASRFYSVSFCRLSLSRCCMILGELACIRKHLHVFVEVFEKAMELNK